MPNKWRIERSRDYYFQKAKENGYRSRAAYKLKQLNDKFHFFDEASTVLDLGAAPGGWLQVASENIPVDGFIVGVDTEEVPPLLYDNIVTVMGDLREEETINRIYRVFAGKVDVILSDMAPKVSGVWELDHSRQIYLARITLLIADKLLKKGGWLIVKTFQGKEHSEYIRDVKNMFQVVKKFKPRASRKQSAEIYIVASKLKKNRRLPKELDKKENF